MVLRFSKIIVASEVPVWSEGFFCDLEKIICYYSICSIDVSNKLNTFLLLLEFEQAVDDVVSARCCVTEHKYTDLSSESFGSNILESVVQSFERHVG